MGFFDDGDRGDRDDGITGGGMHTQVQPDHATGPTLYTPEEWDQAVGFFTPRLQAINASDQAMRNGHAGTFSVDNLRDFYQQYRGQGMDHQAALNAVLHQFNSRGGKNIWGAETPNFSPTGTGTGSKPQQGTREWVDYMFAQTPGNRKPTDRDYQYWLDPARRGSNPDNWDYVEQRMLEPDTGGGGGGTSNAGAGGFHAPAQANLPEFQKPADFKFDASSVLDDPGFQGRLKEANDALQRSAAAKGTLLTGQTLKDLGEQSQVFASNEIGNAYGRAADTYDKSYRNALTDYGNKYGRANDIFNRAMGEYTLNRDTQWGNDDRNFSRLFSMANFDADQNHFYDNLDYNYANLYGNTITNGGARANDQLTGGANATAAGQIGRGNAWGGAINNGVNTGLGLYVNSQYGRPRTNGAGTDGGF